MKLVKTGLILSALTFFIAACGDAPQTGGVTNQSNTAVNATPVAEPTAAPDEFAEARKIYNDKCAECHKENGTGGVVEVDGKKFKSEDFTSDKMKKMSDDKYVRYITNGIPSEGMPAFKDQLSPEQINDLVRFIRNEFQSAQ